MTRVAIYEGKIFYRIDYWTIFRKDNVICRAKYWRGRETISI